MMRALGKFLAGLLIFLLALVVLIVGAVFVADGMIRDEVEQRAARALQSGLGLGSPPRSPSRATRSRGTCSRRPSPRCGCRATP
ncbi:hypothetical protein G7070_13680 [Propioniciclava coleopterorum]|uniref:Uncharacterized protein n=1 Tax=Propioniciclava coleopterorum TaxID=2714937 RepID=A0A6G7Y925_9ACTN|nr:hypothetical protein [Propioniciclava coleopterorum]QIK73117.1 hypothetical protein G7070_13680 [Propioniciclava coleopterorum]